MRCLTVSGRHLAEFWLVSSKYRVKIGLRIHG
jgi:hypothetical protein